MSEKMDRRQARTKQLLNKALMELIEEKGTDGVTVTDIATRADINRGTFYLHYRDVPDMLEQIKEEVFVNIEKCILQLDINEVIKNANTGKPYPISVMIFEEIARHADFLKVMFGPKGDLSYAIRFRNFMATHIFNKLSYLQPAEDNFLIPRDYLIAYMSSANFGMLMHWLESGMKQTPYQMGLIMTQIALHGPIASAGLKSN
ncbi:TetR/AcrR family transcriptional regulator [Paenibacillus sedimenti]|uniref:TetR/AcrR family transcriptional regulator n=1 Tax=Paenibacillus sedimenti TaxID=2770274 RepID=A0A926QL26_9BACL|nr:TetR/AcrR family transcriptional regulator [Paenibacillus sedimenti]MBD0382029.1 TetR/AcrR family transcriptional regulator [Paenibacillus sedimenti]